MATANSHFQASRLQAKPDLSDFWPALELEKSHTAQAAKSSISSMSKIQTHLMTATSSSKPLMVEEEDGEVIPVKTLEQLRAEKIEKIKFLAPKHPFKRSNVPSRMILNSKCREIQKRLSEQGKYVNWQEVIYELLESFEDCEQIGDLGLSQVDNLEAINDLLRKQRQIDNFILVSEARLPFLNLVDLEVSIVHNYNHTQSVRMQSSQGASNNLSNKIARFEEMFVGPLIKNQLIRQLFRFPDNVTSIRQLTPLSAYELINNLYTFLRDNSFWNKKIKEAEFEKFLVDKYKVLGVWQLGIRLNNLGMMIGSIKSVQHLYSEVIKIIDMLITIFFQLYSIAAG
jgi:hypothetical protein